MFLLGHWKDYEELEDRLSMPELIATLKAMYNAEYRRNKFAAGLQGVDLDESSSEATSSSEGPSTYQEIQARAAARLNADEKISSAIEYGFTPDFGVSYDIIRSGGK